MARPKLGDSASQRLQMVITEDEVNAIEDWQFANRVPSKSEAIRRLCQIGLLADAKVDKLETSGQSVTDTLFEWLKTAENSDSSREEFNERIPEIMSDQLELAVEIFTLSKPIKALRSTGTLEDVARSTAEISRSMEQTLRDLKAEHQASREEYRAAKEGKA